RAQITRCVNNLRQIGAGVEMYLSDNRDTMPPNNTDQLAGRPASSNPVWFGLCMGGKDPAPAFLTDWALAKDRPLQNYVSEPESFRCTADKGQEFPITGGPWLKPSDWESVGCSYRFNGIIHPLTTLMQVPADSDYNLCGKKESWVPDPARFIMMHEVPGY